MSVPNFPHFPHFPNYPNFPNPLRLASAKLLQHAAQDPENLVNVLLLDDQRR